MSDYPALDPFVITLELDKAATDRFNAERSELFPPGRTKIGAHLTLFHAIPGSMEAQVLTDVAQAASRPGFDVAVSQVIALGRGAAYSLESGELNAIHRQLRSSWEGHLTRQDRQGFRPHVTVQNKVEPDVAKATVAKLSAAFVPFTARGEAMTVWRYVGGPWELVRRFEFDGPIQPTRAPDD